MSIEIRGIYNRVERSIVLERDGVIGSQEIRDLLATHFQLADAEELRWPLEHVDAITAYCQTLFEETFWRSDHAPAEAVVVAEAPAMAIEPEHVTESRPSEAEGIADENVRPRRRRR